MASEQAGARKKQTRNLSREEHRHPVLYRHQDCIPNSKLLQNCERHSLLGLKNNQDLECHGKLVSEHDTNNLKNKTKQSNSKVKNDGKSEKSLQGAKVIPEQSNETVGNSEEPSKSRRRRLRKRRLLVSLASSASDTHPKPGPPVESNPQAKPISRTVAHPSSVVPPAPSTSATRAGDSVKSLAKESRKRLDKSVGSRNKSIKSKSLVEPTNQSKTDIIKTLEEKTLNSLLQTLVPLTNSSPKKEKASVPLFSFPEIKLNSCYNKDGVFYFGETKHQLEQLTSGSANYNSSPIQEKSELEPKLEINKNYFSASKPNNLENCDSSYNVPPVVNSILTSLAAVKQHLFDTESVTLTRNLENNEPIHYQTLQDLFAIPVLKDPSKSEEVLNFNLPPACAPVTSGTNRIEVCENNPIQVSNNFTKPVEKTQSVCSTTTPISEGQSKSSQINCLEDIKSSLTIMKPTEELDKSSKTREEIKLEREAKKAAKLAAKTRYKTSKPSNTDVTNENCKLKSTIIADNQKFVKPEKKDSKPDLETSFSSQAFENRVYNDKEIPSDIKSFVSSLNKDTLNDMMKTALFSMDPSKEVSQDSSTKSKAELKAERRAKQEAQRAAKASSKNLQPKLKEKIVLQIKNEQPKSNSTIAQIEKKPEVTKTLTQPKPKLFSHLYQDKTHLCSSEMLKVGGLHPAIVRLGMQYAARVVVGSNARCVALLHALKQMVNDYTTPSEKEFSRGLEEELGPVMAYLNQCRPLAVSMTNALRHIKRTLTQLPNSILDVEARQKICDVVDTYIHEQVDVAGKAICNTVKQKIANGDVILTYGCSSLVYKILVESHQSGTKFKVVIVDGLPWREGREMLRRLVEKGLSCTYVLLTAASFIMREASKVLLGAHALLANGYVMSRAGSSQVALLAHCYNVPVLVCCETHKFCERVQTDAFVYNELGELCCDNIKEKGRALPALTPLSLAYDITPPDLVSAVVTELAVLPCTSVPVILRIKPSESAM